MAADGTDRRALIEELEAALSRFPKKAQIRLEVSGAPLATLEGPFAFSRFDGAGADVLVVEMVPEWTLHLHTARITSWHETKRPRALKIEYADVEISLVSAPQTVGPTWPRTLERFG